MGIFDGLSFNQKIDFLSDTKVKKALKDGKIDDNEKAIFEKHGVNDISDSDISEIENSYLELESYIENNKKANKTEKAEETKNSKMGAFGGLI